MAKNDNWKMPAHLEKYRGFVCNTGGNDIEDLMNDHSSTTENNAVRALLCVAVSSQMHLLESLHIKGLIK